MAKKKLTLSVDGEIIEKAKELKVNFSSFLEIKLLEYIALVEEIVDEEREERTYGDLNPSIRLRRPEGYPDYLIGPQCRRELFTYYKT